MMLAPTDFLSSRRVQVHPGRRRVRGGAGASLEKMFEDTDAQSGDDSNDTATEVNLLSFFYQDFYG